MKITDTVYMLDCTPQSHAYLILAPEIMLVDTCLPGSGKKILEEIKSLKIEPQQIKHILLTHHDGDHIGSAAMLEQATGATVWASSEDIPYIFRQKARPGIKKYISMVMRMPLPSRVNPYPAEMKIGEVQVLSTPGHTPGHVSFLYQDVLLAGDLVATQNGKIKPSPAMLTWDMPMLMESIKKISPLPFKWVCPAHGMPVERGDQWEKLV
jgi:glyoxylase-like metal-dependent hydrolase (beta-lactamase superfamily II)